MIWYAATTARRTRQVVADIALLGWLAGCGVAGGLVHGAIAQLAGPAHALREAAGKVDGGIAQTQGRAAEVPLVGDRLSDALAPLTAANQDVDAAAAEFVAAVDRLAWTVGLLSGVVPALTVLLVWAWVRLRFARRATATQRLIGSGVNLDLLALRAMTRSPLATLAGINPDPVGALRRRDAQAVARLADLELAHCGLPPSSALARGVPPA